MKLRRRDFVKQSSLLALAASVPGFLARTARATTSEKDSRVLVVLQLSGGNDGINTVVPYSDEGYQRYRKELRIPTKDLLKINDQIGLHPELNGFARLLQSDRLAIVQGVGYPNPSRSHFKSMAYWQTARFDEPNDDGQFIPGLVKGMGWIGTAMDDVTSSADRGPNSVFVGLEQTPPALRGRRSTSSAIARLDDLVLAGNGITSDSNSSETDSSDLASFVERTTLDAFVTAERLKAANLGKETGPRYPSGQLAQKLQVAARLIKADFGTRVFYVDQAGYDTHSTQMPQHEKLLENLGDAVRAFMDDLTQSHLDERVTLLIFSEFGRRVAENSSFGTDHGTAAPVFLAGGSVQSGLFGTTPSLLDLEDGDLKSSVDFRSVYATLLEDWLGLTAEKSLGGSFPRLPLIRKA